MEALDGSIGHSKVVALLSYAIASELDIAEQEKTEILNSAFVADIGKEVISHHLLNRRGTLSANELLEVRKHAIEGTRILKAKGYESKYMLKIIRHSHECFNGSGHPDGLEGEEIPIGSRIVKVADSYNALTSWRPYRESIEQVSALDEIKGLTDRGIFDPNIVETLNRLISE